MCFISLLKKNVIHLILLQKVNKYSVSSRASWFKCLRTVCAVSYFYINWAVEGSAKVLFWPKCEFLCQNYFKAFLISLSVSILPSIE